jgi:hypothetical protein
MSIERTAGKNSAGRNKNKPIQTVNQEAAKRTVSPHGWH